MGQAGATWCKCPEAPSTSSGCGQDVKRCTFAPWHRDMQRNAHLWWGSPAASRLERARCVACFLQWGWRCGMRIAPPSRCTERTMACATTWSATLARRSPFEMTREPRWTSTGRRWLGRCSGTPTNSPGWNRKFTPRWPVHSTLGSKVNGHAPGWCVRRPFCSSLEATKVAMRW